MYITTPIYYVNDKPHLGHSYTTLAADILARWARMRGEEAFFLTGTDENSQKNVEAALASGTKDIQKYIDEMSAFWQSAWDSLNITNDDFIRTTENRHKKGVIKFFKAVYKKGDIYKGKYEGLYCVGCEAFITQSDLVKGKCPHHKKEPEKIVEENYFFKASRYKKKVLSHIKKNPEFIQPVSRRNEVISYIKNHFVDVSISRQSVKWGIPLPIDESQVIYVWFDALINYLTGIGYGTDDSKFKKYWPADVHLMAKDIIKFHCALWPAMLMSAGLELPRRIFAHGFFTIDGKKISKSLGNAIDPIELSQKFGLDALRYFLFREIVFGQDGDFSIQRFAERYQSDLANGLGNLVSRVLSLVGKGEARIWNLEFGILNNGLQSLTEKTWQEYEEALENLAFYKALGGIWELISFCDGYIEKTKPWDLVKKDKEKLDEVLVNLLEILRHIAHMLWPFMPETSDKILDQFGVRREERKKSLKEIKKWGSARGLKPKKGEALFPRL